MIEISAQPKLKVSNFHLGIAFIQNQWARGYAIAKLGHLANREKA